MAEEVRPSVISKVTVKSVGADPKEAIRQNKKVPLARFWGVAEAIKYVNNRTTGDVNIALLGSFRAQNMETGEVFDSGVMYLPGGLHDQLSGPFVRAKDQHATVEPIKFAIEVLAVPSKNPGGYSYEGRQLMKQEGVDPLAEMSSAFVMALPKPGAAKK